ncbi:MAG: ATP-binding cassette domain-containing protein [Candidatus Omnitrophica bacterium]|nr:ATP-binding cassette domain-containing protein [Candidatus Omnitrophota bacterium]
MIELKNINKIYRMGKVEVKALNNISLKVERGEFVAIMGPSGSGKSTLLHIIGFLDKPDSGSYTILDNEITRLKDNQQALLRNQLVGFVFQQFNLLPRITALANVGLPLIYSGRQTVVKNALDKIQAVGLASRATHRPNELSGGEQQRVAIARSLVNEPFVILADEPTGNLDSKSEEEIIAILEHLNKSGKTIIMVTHEQEIAQHAQRIISMRDGCIISDERKQSVSVQVAEGAQAALKNIISNAHSVVSKTELLDHVKQSYGAIISNKMRSFLSMLGILIGVAAVITVLALGQGARESVEQRMQYLGANLLIVRPGARTMHGVTLESEAVAHLTEADAEAIGQLPEIKYASPAVGGSVHVVHENKNFNTLLHGQGINYQHIRYAQPTKGRFFTEEEVLEKKKVAVIGTTVAGNLFGNKDPIGKEIKINRISFLVIGVLPKKGGADRGFDQDDIVIIPISTAMDRVLGQEYVGWIDVQVKDKSLIEQAEKSVQSLMRKRHRLREKQEDTFDIHNMTRLQNVLTGQARDMSILLICVASISLLVGGIGIMNIMLVSVTERTREIGLRKALGAKNRDIMSQFLIESVVLAFNGGFLGIMLGSGISITISQFAKWPTKISFLSILLAFGFSVTIGLLFGLFPANKAAKLNPIEALRYE